MLRAIILFAILAFIFGIVGFSGIASAFSSIAYVLAVMFAVLFIASFVLSLFQGSTSTGKLI